MWNVHKLWYVSRLGVSRVLHVRPRAAMCHPLYLQSACANCAIAQRWGTPESSLICVAFLSHSKVEALNQFETNTSFQALHSLLSSILPFNPYPRIIARSSSSSNNNNNQIHSAKSFLRSWISDSQEVFCYSIVKIFIAFYGTRRINTVFTRVRNWTPFWARWI
jgi:hypothetical protein